MRPSILTNALLTTLVMASPLYGQRPATIGLAGGVSLPQGRFGDRLDAGWHADLSPTLRSTDYGS